ncbi:MAG: cupredoxin family protein [Alphaproteobacteria bacterium]|nr:cupredoxin family protein [Alphaproteobacteria bacterium]
MIRPSTIAAITILTAASLLPSIAGAEPATHSHEHEALEHETFSAGEPGDPNELSRTIPIIMEESDGKMLYVPDRIEINKDETIKFVIQNHGELDHEFVLASVEDNLKHAKAMEMNPEMEHDDPNAIRVAPQQTGEIIWKFNKVGQFEYACLIPGHRDAGMLGIVEVK